MAIDPGLLENRVSSSAQQSVLLVPSGHGHKNNLLLIKSALLTPRSKMRERVSSLYRMHPLIPISILSVSGSRTWNMIESSRSLFLMLKKIFENLFPITFRCLTWPLKLCGPLNIYTACKRID